MIAYFKRRRKGFELLVFTLPAVLLILCMSEVPFVMNIYYSFTKWNGMAGTSKWIGFANFKEIFTDDSYVLDAAIFTLKYTLVTAIAINIVAIVLAIILNKNLKYKNLLRTLFFLPFVLSLLITSYMWKFIFTKGFDLLYQMTGFECFNWGWLGTPKLAFISIVIVSVWKLLGYNMVIYIAGLQAIPKDLLEASEIDGASARQRVFRITLPLLMPAITISLFLTISGGLNIFDIPLAMTGGGPGTATTGIAMDIYKAAFTSNRFGYATAKSLLFFIVATTIAFIQVSITKKKEVEA
jgi:raffinose/stachyose/melibiose transport system permease protein